MERVAPNTCSSAHLASNVAGPRRQTGRACDNCRRKKSKCDGSAPPCKPCLLANIECEWTSRDSRLGSSSKLRPDIAALELRVATLERVRNSRARDIAVLELRVATLEGMLNSTALDLLLDPNTVVHPGNDSRSPASSSPVTFASGTEFDHFSFAESVNNPSAFLSRWDSSPSWESSSTSESSQASPSGSWMDTNGLAGRFTGALGPENPIALGLTVAAAPATSAFPTHCTQDPVGVGPWGGNGFTWAGTRVEQEWAQFNPPVAMVSQDAWAVHPMNVE